MQKCNWVRNQIWDLLITRGMLYHWSYLSIIIWQALSRIIRLGPSSHSAHSRLERWDRENSSNSTELIEIFLIEQFFKKQCWFIKLFSLYSSFYMENYGWRIVRLKRFKLIPWSLRILLYLIFQVCCVQSEMKDQGI